MTWWAVSDASFERSTTLGDGTASRSRSTAVDLPVPLAPVTASIIRNPVRSARARLRDYFSPAILMFPMI